jgi:hypothetical protein
METMGVGMNIGDLHVMSGRVADICCCKITYERRICATFEVHEKSQASIKVQDKTSCTETIRHWGVFGSSP